MNLLPLRSHVLGPALALACAFLTACGGSAGDDSTGRATMDTWARFNATGAPLPEPSEEDVLETQTGHAARLNRTELETKRAQALRTGGGQLAGLTRKAYTDQMPVYRFYNGSTGAHFFTASGAERDQVIATLPQFQYEGQAFVVSGSAQPGLSPVHRFYNTARGVHFFTISESEKAYIQANLPAYQYEGIAYYASATPGAGLKPLFRFYRLGVKSHFYSGSVDERNTVVENFCDYRYEGTAYYVIDPSASGVEPPVPHTSRTVLLIGDSLTQGYGYGVTGGWFSFVSPGQVWSQRLAAAIPARTGHGCDRVVDVSLGGMQTHHGVERLGGWLDRYWPSHIILAQGTNDAWQSVDMDEIRGNLTWMVQTGRNAGARLYVMAFLFYPWGDDYQRALTSTYQGVAAANGAVYFSATGHLPRSDTYYFPDDVHLRDAAQPSIMETVWSVLQPSF